MIRRAMPLGLRFLSRCASFCRRSGQFDQNLLRTTRIIVFTGHPLHIAPIGLHIPGAAPVIQLHIENLLEFPL